MSCRETLFTNSWLQPIRYLLAFVYGFFVYIRNLFYDIGLFKIHKIKTKVISVGNISVGGSGKTVLVQALIEHLLSLNKRPAVLSRGYGRLSKGLVVVADEQGLKANPTTGGDEPCLIAMNFPGVPVVVAENRVLGARYLEAQYSPDVIFLDDGFQHRRLRRDLDILIIDSPEHRPDHLLPRGRLREPLSTQSRADIIVYSKFGVRGDTAHDLKFQMASHVVDSDGHELLLSDLKGTVSLFAGIGAPQPFFHYLKTQLKDVGVTLAFQDHVIYSPLEMSLIAQAGADLWVTTQKDFVKLDPQFCREFHIYYLPLKGLLPEALLEPLKDYFN